jgi:hypothetical protein
MRIITILTGKNNLKSQIVPDHLRDALELSKLEIYSYKLKINEAHTSSLTTIQVITPKGSFLAPLFLFLGLFDLF